MLAAATWAMSVSLSALLFSPPLPATRPGDVQAEPAGARQPARQEIGTVS
jgi:hypothetical protein